MERKSLFRISIIILVLLNGLDINIFFHHYAKQFTDSDQLIFWAQAKDVSEGVFRSLYLYGQDYNIPLESFIAAPMIASGVPIQNALVIVNLIMTFACFILLSILAFRKGSWIGSLISLAVPLIMPVEWLILTSSARGFIGGVVFAVIGTYFISKNKSFHQTLGLVLMFIGYTISPNAVVVIIPTVFYYILNTKQWYKALAISAIPMIIWFAITLYAKGQLDHVVHQSWKIEWTTKAFKHCIAHFNDLFKGVLPILYELGALVLMYLAAFLYWSYKRNEKLFYVMVVFILFLIMSMGINKVADGTHSIYFPYARMFIGLPFVLLWFAIKLSAELKIKNSIMVIGGLIIVLGFGLKHFFFSERIGRALKTNSGVVQVRYIPDLKDQCRTIDSVFRAENKEVLVFHYKADELSFGCSIFYNTPTLHPPYERRTWLMKSYANTQVKDAMFYDWTAKLPNEKPRLEVYHLNELNNAFYLTNSSLQLKDVYPQAFNFVR